MSSQFILNGTPLLQNGFEIIVFLSHFGKSQMSFATFPFRSCPPDASGF
jgi:hypothetical protein